MDPWYIVQQVIPLLWVANRELLHSAPALLELIFSSLQTSWRHGVCRLLCITLSPPYRCVNKELLLK
jgi:hypothetical protein